MRSLYYVCMASRAVKLWEKHGMCGGPFPLVRICFKSYLKQCALYKLEHFGPGVQTNTHVTFVVPTSTYRIFKYRRGCTCLTRTARNRYAMDLLDRICCTWWYSLGEELYMGEQMRPSPDSSCFSYLGPDEQFVEPESIAVV
jgi:hypothetical protein